MREYRVELYITDIWVRHDKEILIRVQKTTIRQADNFAKINTRSYYRDVKDLIYEVTHSVNSNHDVICTNFQVLSMYNIGYDIKEIPNYTKLPDISSITYGFKEGIDANIKQLDEYLSKEYNLVLPIKEKSIEDIDVLDYCKGHIQRQLNYYIHSNFVNDNDKFYIQEKYNEDCIDILKYIRDNKPRYYYIAMARQYKDEDSIQWLVGVLRLKLDFGVKK